MNLRSLYSVIWEQMSRPLQEKVESQSTFETSVEEPQDSIMLLRMIKTLAYKFEESKKDYTALVEALRTFYSFRQGAEMSNSAFYERFKNNVEVIEHIGGSIGIFPSLVAVEGARLGVTTDS